MIETESRSVYTEIQQENLNKKLIEASKTGDWRTSICMVLDLVRVKSAGGEFPMK